MTRQIARSAQIAALAATAVAGAVLTASQSAPAIRIASPGEGAYVSGSTRLVAVLDPPSASRSVERVTFFVGGIQVCSVTRPPFECEWDAGDRIAEHQVRVAASMRNGERLVHSVRTRGTEFAENVDVDAVQVTAVVTDGDGRFVKGLRREDFTVLEDGKLQQIVNFASQNIPLEMVTALDVSSSMELALPRVKQSAKKFLAGLRSEDQVTILAFNDVIFTIARRSTDQSYRERVIDHMRPWGGTALHDVIIKAVDILGRQSGRRSIVLFSDGDDQSSLAPLSAAITRTEGSDATIYAIGQGRAVHNRHLQELMRRIATVSGGRAFFTEEEEKLDIIFEEILEDLRNQYLLSYDAPSSVRDGKWHDIKVQVAGGKHKVRARQGYRLKNK